jgi:hypothetical protein
MRNLFSYYIVAFLPLGILIFLGVQNYIDTSAFVLLLFAYLLLYRTWTDGSRLVSKGIITKKDRWKMMLPGMHMKHFTELYLK